MNRQHLAAWRDALDARATQPPARLRVALWAGQARIGSVEPDYLPRMALRSGLVQAQTRGGESGWCIMGEPTESLRELALAMRDADLAPNWRDEQLPVTDESGRRLGTVERAVVRPLGITTFAVHLAGLSPEGAHWVQQRALDKPNDPGLWDTLMGGMIPAGDSLQQALARETWEEAGLRLAQLAQLQHGGRISIRRPTADVQAGYVVEHIEWYRCVVPEGVVPVNQDGEVAQFRLMQADELIERMLRDEFTLEAARIFCALTCSTVT